MILFKRGRGKLRAAQRKIKELYVELNMMDIQVKRLKAERNSLQYANATLHGEILGMRQGNKTATEIVQECIQHEIEMRRSVRAAIGIDDGPF